MAGCRPALSVQYDNLVHSQVTASALYWSVFAGVRVCVSACVCVTSIHVGMDLGVCVWVDTSICVGKAGCVCVG